MGELFALAAAVLWAFAVILFKRSGETVSPFALNLFRVLISGVIFVSIIAILNEPLISRAPRSDYLILFASGIIGIALADTLFHKSLNIVGAGITAIVDCLYSPLVVLFAFHLLEERIGIWQLAGMAFIVLGVFIASRHKPPPGTTRRTLVQGVVWGVLGMVALSLGIVIAKPVLNRVPVLWATTMRQIGALAVMLPIAVFSPHRRDYLAVFKPVPTWRFTLTGTILGSCLALLFWIAGMKYTDVSIAAILNQTTTIYMLIFATIFLKEAFTRQKAAASLLALLGIGMVILG
jgi:drug/metabolite transporter (DMT)-like permease